MARFRVYIKPFTDSGEYASEYTEITSDVASLGDPKQAIDNTDFNVGVIRNNGLSLTLRNDLGYYSDVNDIKSVFRHTRKNTQVKITWDFRSYDLICGFFRVNREPLGGEVTVFEGLINDVTTFNKVNLQQAVFTVLGLESLLDDIETPYSSISNGDTFQSVLYACLNQAPFNELITVSLANISPAVDLAIDDKTNLENQTVGQTLQDLLLAANSVLYIKNRAVYVSSRAASTDSMFTFYGQASNNGLENIIDVPKFRDGVSRMFNLWTWTGTAFDARDTSSISLYGVRPKTMKLELVDDGSSAKIQSILNANRDEFAFPKRELDLETPIWYDSLELNILDKVNIDYPTIFIPFDGGDLPRYGIDAYDGTARYPYEQWALTLDADTDFKIMAKKINVAKQTILFSLREI